MGVFNGKFLLCASSTSEDDHQEGLKEFVSATKRRNDVESGNNDYERKDI